MGILKKILSFISDDTFAYKTRNAFYIEDLGNIIVYSSENISEDSKELFYLYSSIWSGFEKKAKFGTPDDRQETFKDLVEEKVKFYDYNEYVEDEFGNIKIDSNDNMVQRTVRKYYSMGVSSTLYDTLKKLDSELNPQNPVLDNREVDESYSKLLKPKK